MVPNGDRGRFRWSFGVLVYELFTLGNTPYPGLDPCDVEHYLDSGRRMPQPPQCPLDLYMVMLSCWQEFPESRPTFTDLRQRLVLMLENIANDYYYTQVHPSVAVERRRSSVRNADQNDQWPTVDEGDMDDHVFEAEIKAKPDPPSAAPPLPPRRFRSRSSATSATGDDSVPPYSPTRRTHQRESASSANGEPALINEGGPEQGGFKLRYVARYTPSVDLTTVPEKERVGDERGSISTMVTNVPSEPESPRLRRRSSTFSNQTAQHSN